MTRKLFTFVAFAVLAGWASAYNPQAETTAERMDRFARNRGLLEDLVTRGVELANAPDPVARAAVAQSAAADLSQSLRDAVADDDAQRVAELGDHLGALYRDAVLPTLAEAKTKVPVASPDAKRLAAVKTAAAADARKAATAIPTTGKVGQSARAAAVRAALTDAAAELTK